MSTIDFKNTHPLMTILDHSPVTPGPQRCCHVAPVHKALWYYEHKWSGGILECFLEVDQETFKGSEIDTAQLAYAYVRDIDVSEILSQDVIDDIEKSYLMGRQS